MKVSTIFEIVMATIVVVTISYFFVKKFNTNDAEKPDFSAATIFKVVLIKGHYLTPNTLSECLIIDEKSSIELLNDIIKKSDNRSHGGHAVAISELRISFLSNDNSYTYMGTIFDKLPNDLLIANYKMIRGKNSYYADSIGRYRRVPNFKIWLNTVEKLARTQQCILPGERKYHSETSEIRD